MKIIIDRFEGAFAVAQLPDGQMADIPISVLPGIKEGDIVLITKDAEGTAHRTSEMERLLNEVLDD